MHAATLAVQAAIALDGPQLHPGCLLRCATFGARDHPGAVATYIVRIPLTVVVSVHFPLLVPPVPFDGRAI